LPLRLSGFALSELPRSIAAWTRVRTVVNEPLEADPADAIEAASPGLGVELHGVSFVHEGEDLPTVIDVDLAVPTGSVTALVGPTGSGKSTLSMLVAGLVAPTSGVVRLAPGVRSVVFQEAFLLGGTVADNVRMGADYTDEQLWDALDMAAARDFVGGLPAGLDTLVGQRGESLSAGERQLVALLRAHLADPDLLVLDEATSAVDPQLEMRIGRALERLMSGRTSVTIAHRMSTAESADEVVVVDRGRVVQRGPHAELVAETAGVYAGLHASWVAQQGK